MYFIKEKNNAQTIIDSKTVKDAYLQKCSVMYFIFVVKKQKKIFFHLLLYL